MKSFISIIVIVSILIIGYYLLKPSIPERKPINIEKVDIEEQALPIQDKNNTKAKQVNTTATETIQTIKEKIPAVDSFSNTETGKNLSRLVELLKTLDNPTSVKGKEAWAKLDTLKQVPDKTFSEIKSALSKIEDKDETKKQFLIQFASGLNIDKNKRLGLLSEELEQAINNTQSSDNIQAQMTPSIIFETYIRLANDDKLSENLLVKVLPKSSPQIQRTLLSSFNKVDPSRTDELIEEYGLNN